MGKKMPPSHGTGAYAVLVTWKTKDGNGDNEETFYRYETEDLRNKKLKAFKSNSKVKNAVKMSGYASW